MALVLTVGSVVTQHVLASVLGTGCTGGKRKTLRQAAQCWLSVCETQGSVHKAGVAACPYDPITWEVVAGGARPVAWEV